MTAISKNISFTFSQDTTNRIAITKYPYSVYRQSPNSSQTSMKDIFILKDILYLSYGCSLFEVTLTSDFTFNLESRYSFSNCSVGGYRFTSGILYADNKIWKISPCISNNYLFNATTNTCNLVACSDVHPHCATCSQDYF